MNIFFYHTVAEICARMYCLTHVNKMIVEYCQLLCTVLCLNEHGGGVEVIRKILNKKTKKYEDKVRLVPELLENEKEEWKDKIKKLEAGWREESGDISYFFCSAFNERHPCTISIARSKHLFNWVAHLADAMCKIYEVAFKKKHKSSYLVSYLLRRGLNQSYLDILEKKKKTGIDYKIRIKENISPKIYLEYVAYKLVEPIQLTKLKYGKTEGTCEVALVTTVDNPIKNYTGLFDTHEGELKNYGFRIIVKKNSLLKTFIGNIDVVQSYRANFNISKNQLGEYTNKDNIEVNQVPKWYKPLKTIEVFNKGGKGVLTKNYALDSEWDNEDNWVDGNPPQNVTFLRHNITKAQYTKRRDQKSMESLRNYPNTPQEEQIAIIPLIYDGKIIPRKTKNHREEKNRGGYSIPEGLVPSNPNPKPRSKANDKPSPKRNKKAKRTVIESDSDSDDYDSNVKKKTFDTFNNKIKELDEALKDFNGSVEKGQKEMGITYVRLIGLHNMTTSNSVQDQTKDILNSIIDTTDRTGYCQNARNLIESSYISEFVEFKGRPVLFQCNYGSYKTAQKKTTSVVEYFSPATGGSALFPTNDTTNPAFALDSMVASPLANLYWTEGALEAAAGAWRGNGGAPCTVFHVHHNDALGGKPNGENIMFKINTANNLYNSVVTVNSLTSFFFSVAAYFIRRSEPPGANVQRNWWTDDLDATSSKYLASLYSEGLSGILQDKTQIKSTGRVYPDTNLEEKTEFETNDDLAVALKICSDLTKADSGILVQSLNNRQKQSQFKTARYIQNFLHDALSEDADTKFYQCGTQTSPENSNTFPEAIVIEKGRSKRGFPKALLITQEYGSDQRIAVIYESVDKIKKSTEAALRIEEKSNLETDDGAVRVQGRENTGNADKLSS